MNNILQSEINVNFERLGIKVKQNGIVLMFIPDCRSVATKIQLTEFRRSNKKFAEIGWNIVVILNEPREKIQEYCQENSIEFQLISDVESTLASVFNVNGKYDRNIIKKPLRRTFLIDKNLNLIERFNFIRPSQHSEEIYSYLQNPAFETIHEKGSKSHDDQSVTEIKE